MIYKGPFKKVLDDDGHAFERGERSAVCDKTFQLYQREPYRGAFECIEPRTPVAPIAPEDARPFDCSGLRLRQPKETKGQDYDATTDASQCRDGGDCC